MRKSEIQVGKTYHNGKEGRFYQERTIVDAGPGFLIYSGQTNTDCVQYQVTRKGSVKVSTPYSNMTRLAMANWAKGKVTPHE